MEDNKQNLRVIETAALDAARQIEEAKAAGDRVIYTYCGKTLDADGRRLCDINRSVNPLSPDRSNLMPVTRYYYDGNNRK